MEFQEFDRILPFSDIGRFRGKLLLKESGREEAKIVGAYLFIQMKNGSRAPVLLRALDDGTWLVNVGAQTVRTEQDWQCLAAVRTHVQEISLGSGANVPMNLDVIPGPMVGRQQLYARSLPADQEMQETISEASGRLFTTEGRDETVRQCLVSLVELLDKAEIRQGPAMVRDAFEDMLRNNPHIARQLSIKTENLYRGQPFFKEKFPFAELIGSRLDAASDPTLASGILNGLRISLEHRWSMARAM